MRRTSSRARSCARWTRSSSKARTKPRWPGAPRADGGAGLGRGRLVEREAGDTAAARVDAVVRGVGIGMTEDVEGALAVSHLDGEGVTCLGVADGHEHAPV